MAIKKTSKSKSQPKVTSSPPAKGKGSPTTSRGIGSSKTARGLPAARPGPLTARLHLAARLARRQQSRAAKPAGSNAGSLSAAPAKGKPAPPPARSGLSLDRKLDIIGIVLVVIGLLTLLSLVSQRNSIWTGSWVRLLGRVFGLGMYLFPLALLAGGGWLVLRNFERVPRLAAERVIGILLLFTNLLAWLHLGMATYTRLQVFDLAQAGRGGGYLGAAVIGGLEAGLGLAGAVTVLLGWLLIGLALTLDVSVLDLFGWIPPLIQRLQDGVIERVEARREGSLPARPAGDLTADGSYYPREAPSTLEAGGLQPAGHYSPCRRCGLCLKGQLIPCPRLLTSSSPVRRSISMMRSTAAGRT